MVRDASNVELRWFLISDGKLLFPFLLCCAYLFLIRSNIHFVEGNDVRMREASIKNESHFARIVNVGLAGILLCQIFGDRHQIAWARDVLTVKQIATFRQRRVRAWCFAFHRRECLHD